ncbi:MAG: hypothetical protein WD579_01620 [Candidatus Paceibacterota bacterium]
MRIALFGIGIVFLAFGLWGFGDLFIGIAFVIISACYFWAEYERSLHWRRSFVYAALGMDGKI